MPKTKEITKEIAAELMISEENVQMVAKEFDLTLEELLEAVEECNVRSFETLEDLFIWLHEGAPEDDLISLLWEGKTYMDEAIYVDLDEDGVVYTYSE